MATAAAVQSTDQEIQQAIRELQGQNSKLTPRLVDDEAKLLSLSASLTEAGEAIARGEEKHAKASQLKEEIDEIQVRVKGAKSIIARNNAKIQEHSLELDNRNAEARKAERLQKYKDRVRVGQAIVQAITDKALAIATDDLVRLDEICTELHYDWQDLGGENAGRALVRALLDVDGVFLPSRASRFNGWDRGSVVVALQSLRPKKR